MKTSDHEQAREWLEQQVDGELEAIFRRRLESHLEECADCREQAGRLRALVAELEADRVEPRADLTARIMASLPGTAWEARRPASWWGAAAVAAGLALVGAVLAGWGAADADGGWVAGVGSMLSESLVAGAGMVGASWHAAGLALTELWQRSGTTAAGVGALVVVADLLVWRLLVRRRPVPQRAIDSWREGRGGD